MKGDCKYKNLDAIIHNKRIIGCTIKDCKCEPEICEDFEEEE